MEVRSDIGLSNAELMAATGRQVNEILAAMHISAEAAADIRADRRLLRCR